MRLAAHLGIAGKMPLTDFCNRHSDTSTQSRSPDSQARSFRRGDRVLSVNHSLSALSP